MLKLLGDQEAFGKTFAMIQLPRKTRYLNKLLKQRSCQVIVGKGSFDLKLGWWVACTLSQETKGYVGWWWGVEVNTLRLIRWMESTTD